MCNMFLLLVTLYSAIVAVSTEDAVMVFKVPKKYECFQTNEISILLEDEPLEIRVINSIGIYDGKCDDVRGDTIKFSNTKKYDQGIKATIRRVVSTYGNRWSCSFYSGSWIASTTSCNVQFHLRTKKPIASISLNNNEMDARRTPLSITNYDAEAQYFFEDDETVIIDCKPSSSGLSGSAMMRYFSSTGEPVLETSNYFQDNSLTLRLTKEDHDNYVDCIYTDVNTDVSVSRLVFLLQETSATKSIISLNINGMYVRPSGVEYQQYQQYQHEYHEGEATHITCRTTNDDYLIRLKYGRGKSSQLKVGIYLYSINKYENYSDITCTATKKGSKKVKQTVKVKFIKSSSNFYVTGLDKGKILKKYRESAYSSVIYYQYTGNEMLNLTCTKAGDPIYSSNYLKWMHNDKSINSSMEIDNYSAKRHLTLQLQDRDDNSTIKCVYVPHQISIRLTYKMSDDAELLEMDWIWLTASIAMVVIIVIFIIIITLIAKHFSSKRNKLQQQSSDANNVNPTIGDRTLPQPSQWNETNYTELRESENNEPDYVNKQTKQEKKTTKNDSDNNYENLEFTNRQVVIEPTLNYADIYVANGKREIKNASAANYSQVRFMEVDGSDYVNMGMIQGPSYVNSRSGEKTKPAYCEMQVLQARD